METNLNAAPDWLYLLREFYELYRHLPSGGSSKIRAHQRAVREAISRVKNANAAIKMEPPQQLPATAHLRRALDEGRQQRQASIVRSVDSIRNHLVWQYGYEKMPESLKQKYAYAELCGPTGPILSDEVILGLVLFAPGCTYPAHAHKEITESYICLSGSVSENHQGVYAPGSLIFNPPDQLHRITVSDREPALMAYAWVGPRESLANQKMILQRTKSRRSPSK
ncbi:MAG: dimethlysulfonioproprionate lyase DddL [Rhizobiales bacterium]|nr:dimethlysulfonioproprionate lyase DddL [Hyphomicrobiales bacterium]